MTLKGNKPNQNQIKAKTVKKKKIPQEQQNQKNTITSQSPLTADSWAAEESKVFSRNLKVEATEEE